MKLGKALPIVLSLGLLLPFGGQGKAAEEPQVRVELTVPFSLGTNETLSTIPFTVMGNYMIEDHPNVVLLSGQKYYVQIENGTLSLYQQGDMGFPLPLLQGKSMIKINPTFETDEATVGIQGKKETYSYRGAMEFQIGYKGTKPHIIPINVLGMESYLKGVVPREMSASWEREALKAQAVAARTYAMRQMNVKPGDGFINDTVQYQAYGGTKVEHANSNAAVDETRGEVLTYGGSLIDALFSASNGGYTEAPENVWKGSKGAPYLTAKPDPYDMQISPHRNWQETMTIAQLQSKIKNQTPTVGTIKKVEVRETYPSGRIADLVIEGDKGTLHLSKDAARTVLGLKSARYTVKTNYGGTAIPIPTQTQPLLSVKSATTAVRKTSGTLIVTNQSVAQPLKSANLVIQGATQKKAVSQMGSNSVNPVPQEVPISVTFSGSGWGHGVGMSQWGAKQMAKEGRTYQEILNFYYDPANITEDYGTEN
jgi:stage II sporulation protein D